MISDGPEEALGGCRSLPLVSNFSIVQMVGFKCKFSVPAAEWGKEVVDCCHTGPPEPVFPIETVVGCAKQSENESTTDIATENMNQCIELPINRATHNHETIMVAEGPAETSLHPVTTETDIDTTAELLPSGGIQSHHHAMRIAVSETLPPQHTNIVCPLKINDDFIENQPNTSPNKHSQGQHIANTTWPFSFGKVSEHKKSYLDISQKESKCVSSEGDMEKAVKMTCPTSDFISKESITGDNETSASRDLRLKKDDDQQSRMESTGKSIEPCSDMPKDRLVMGEPKPLVSDNTDLYSDLNDTSLALKVNGFEQFESYLKLMTDDLQEMKHSVCQTNKLDDDVFTDICLPKEKQILLLHGKHKDFLINANIYNLEGQDKEMESVREPPNDIYFMNKVTVDSSTEMQRKMLGIEITSGNRSQIGSAESGRYSETSDGKIDNEKLGYMNTEYQRITSGPFSQCVTTSLEVRHVSTSCESSATGNLTLIGSIKTPTQDYSHINIENKDSSADHNNEDINQQADGFCAEVNYSEGEETYSVKDKEQQNHVYVNNVNDKNVQGDNLTGDITLQSSFKTITQDDSNFNRNKLANQLNGETCSPQEVQPSSFKDTQKQAQVCYNNAVFDKVEYFGDNKNEIGMTDVKTRKWCSSLSMDSDTCNSKMQKEVSKKKVTYGFGFQNGNGEFSEESDIIQKTLMTAGLSSSPSQLCTITSSETCQNEMQKEFPEKDVKDIIVLQTQSNKGKKDTAIRSEDQCISFCFNPSYQCTTSSRDPSYQCTTTSRDPSYQCTTTSRDPSYQCMTTSPDPSYQCTTTSSNPSYQCTTTSPDPSYQCTTNSSTPSYQCTTTSPDPSYQCKYISPEPSYHCTTTSRDPYYQCKSTSPNPSYQCTNTSPDPSNQCTTTSLDPSYQCKYISPEPSYQCTTTSPDPSYHCTTTSPDPSYQCTTTSPNPSYQCTNTSPDPSNQYTTSSLDPSYQCTTTSPNPSYQRTTTSPDSSYQCTTTSPNPSYRCTTMSPDPSYQCTNTSTDPSYQHRTTSPDPLYQRRTTSPDPPYECTTPSPDPCYQITSPPDPNYESTASSSDPSFRCTTSSQDLPYHCKTTSPDVDLEVKTLSADLSDPCTSTSPDPPNHCTNVIATPPDLSFECTTSTANQSYQFTTTSPDPSYQFTILSFELSCRCTTKFPGTNDQITATSPDLSHQCPTTSPDPTCESTTSPDPSQCTTTFPDPSYQCTTSSSDPSYQCTTTSLDPTYQCKFTSSNFSYRCITTSPDPTYQSTTTSPDALSISKAYEIDHVALQTSVKAPTQDEYGNIIKKYDNSFLEELRKIFLDQQGKGLTLLESGIALTNTMNQLEKNVTFVTMRNGSELGIVIKNSNLFLYYLLGKQFYITEQLNDEWFCAQDRITKVNMLVKKVPVTSNWMKSLHNFLCLPNHPSLLIPYAVITDRNGSILFLMEDRHVLGVGTPPLGYEWFTTTRISDLLHFLRYCRRHNLLPRNIEDSILYTEQGLCFDPSSLYNNDDFYELKKCLKDSLLFFLGNEQQEEFDLHPEVLLWRACYFLEEDWPEQINVASLLFSCLEGPIPFRLPYFPNEN